MIKTLDGVEVMVARTRRADTEVLGLCRKQGGGSSALLMAPRGKHLLSMLSPNRSSGCSAAFDFYLAAHDKGKRKDLF